MPRPKQRTPELRQRVIRVALAQLAEAGVAGFTTRTIARGAETSIPAVYELFGDKAGLVREVFFEGFRLLGQRYQELPVSDDPRQGVIDVLETRREFVKDNPVLAEVMFSRPFADFDPGPDELEAGRVTREFVVDRVQRAIEAGCFAGDVTDIAHILLALTQGLVAQEAAGLLGTSQVSVDRRWSLAYQAILAGLSPDAAADAD